MENDEDDVVPFTRRHRTRLDRVERAVYGWEDEGGVPTLGLVISTADLKKQVEGIRSIGNRIVWGLSLLGVLGVLNALHLYGVSDAIGTFLKTGGH